MSHESGNTVALTASLDYINLGLLRRSIGTVYQERGERIQPRLCKVFMDMAQCKADAADMIEAALDWTKRMKNGWWYKSAEEWEQEINISSNRGVKRGRDALEQAGFEVEMRTMPGTNGMCRVYHYRLNIEVFLRRFANVLKVTFEQLIQTFQRLQNADEQAETEQYAKVHIAIQQNDKPLPAKVQTAMCKSAEVHPLYTSNTTTDNSSVKKHHHISANIAIAERYQKNDDVEESDSIQEKVIDPEKEKILNEWGVQGVNLSRCYEQPLDRIRRMSDIARDRGKSVGWFVMALLGDWKFDAEPVPESQPETPEPAHETIPEADAPQAWKEARQTVMRQIPCHSWLLYAPVIAFEQTESGVSVQIEATDDYQFLKQFPSIYDFDSINEIVADHFGIDASALTFEVCEPVEAVTP